MVNMAKFFILAVFKKHVQEYDLTLYKIPNCLINKLFIGTSHEIKLFKKAVGQMVSFQAVKNPDVTSVLSKYPSQFV
jgi:hypothetical protein